MTHEAGNWAIKQRRLKPTTKIVLWHLCDRFNPDYPPDLKDAAIRGVLAQAEALLSEMSGTKVVATEQMRILIPLPARAACGQGLPPPRTCRQRSFTTQART